MVEILSLETPGGKLIDAVAYSDYATIEAQLAEAKEAFAAIDGLAVMEINPSNYDHDDVCELNRNASHASVIARAALSDLEATQPAPKVTDEMVESALIAWFDAEVTWDRGMTPPTRAIMVGSMRAALIAAMESDQ